MIFNAFILFLCSSCIKAHNATESVADAEKVRLSSSESPDYFTLEGEDYYDTEEETLEKDDEIRLTEKVIHGKVQADNETESAEDAGEDEDYYDAEAETFEEDDEIRLTKIVIHGPVEFRTALSNHEMHWDKAIVPYELSDKHKDADKNAILDAMEEFHNKTCVRFKPRKNESTYISIRPGSGCSAVVGRHNQSSNPVTLGENCFSRGIMLHELMHILGFVHEQNRPDRDQYVTIVWNNIKKGSEGNFKVYTWDEVQNFSLSYDYDSVMHYGEFDFAKDRNKATIIPKKKGAKIGQREGFSKNDLVKINSLYDCNKKGGPSKSPKLKKGKRRPKYRMLRFFRSFIVRYPKEHVEEDKGKVKFQEF